MNLEADNLAGATTETLWAEAKGNDVYSLRNTPFYALGVSFGDLIKAKLVDGALLFAGIVKHNGHSTYQVLLRVPKDDPEVTRMLADLCKLHCNVEFASERFLAIDVKPNANIFAVYSELERVEALKLISFQEGHCGHAVTN